MEGPLVFGLASLAIAPGLLAYGVARLRPRVLVIETWQLEFLVLGPVVLFGTVLGTAAAADWLRLPQQYPPAIVVFNAIPPLVLLFVFFFLPLRGRRQGVRQISLLNIPSNQTRTPQNVIAELQQCLGGSFHAAVSDPLTLHGPGTVQITFRTWSWVRFGRDFRVLVRFSNFRNKIERDDAVNRLKATFAGRHSKSAWIGIPHVAFGILFALASITLLPAGLTGG